MAEPSYTTTDTVCRADQPQACGDQPLPAQAPLCGHSAEQFAEVAMMLEPRGALWLHSTQLLRTAVHRAFGGLLSAFEQRLCDLLRESLACESVELLDQWEAEYGLPGACAADYPTDLAGRQAQVCAARQGVGVQTLGDLQALLRRVTGCDHITLSITTPGTTSSMGNPLGSMSTSAMGNRIDRPAQSAFDNDKPEGLCISGIRAPLWPPTVHNVVGGHGPYTGPSSGGYASATAQPLTLIDPAYVPPDNCGMVDHSRVGGHTGGVGQHLTQGDYRFNLMVCLLNKHLPAHVSWFACD